MLQAGAVGTQRRNISVAELLHGPTTTLCWQCQGDGVQRQERADTVWHGGDPALRWVVREFVLRNCSLNLLTAEKGL